MYAFEHGYGHNSSAVKWSSTKRNTQARATLAEYQDWRLAQERCASWRCHRAIHPAVDPRSEEKIRGQQKSDCLLRASASW
jgi:phosphatidate phosphatase APP1